MSSNVVQFLTNKNHLTLGVIFVCLLGLLLVPQELLQRPNPVVEYKPIEVAAPIAAGIPAVLTIPSIGLETDFTEPLGLRADEQVEVPEGYDVVGWYKHSPRPGELGPAVVIGHVDSVAGPAVFYSLGQVVIGDEILVTDEQGIERTFVVERTELYQQRSFPADVVYGNIEYPGLRLITCSGWYDRTVNRYSHNLVVFARLVE